MSILKFLLSLCMVRRCQPFQTSFTRKKHVVTGKGWPAKHQSVIPTPAYCLSSLASSSSGIDMDKDTNGIEPQESQYPKTTSFTSKPMQVFIEDTDAYGVIYNGNYIRSYERALHEFHCKHYLVNDDSTKIRRVSSSDNTPSPIVLNHPDFVVTQCTSHKFKSSPSLGSQYVIKGELVSKIRLRGHDVSEENEKDRLEQEEIWRFEMIEHKGDQSQDDDQQLDLDKNVNEKPPRVYNTATVTVSLPYSPSSTNEMSKKSPVNPFEYDETTKHFIDNFTVHRDEFDIHMPNALPLKTALNLFERVRSNSLGGPEKLREMQEEYNLLWVVTSIDDLKIYPECSEAGKCRLSPGQEVIVKTRAEVKRRGMIVEFWQEIAMPGDSGEVVLAQGIVTICAIDRIKGRPTSKVPAYIKKLFE